MTTGTVDDIIADVSKLSNDMAAALNVLNAKIDSQVSNLQNQINNLGGSGGGGVTAGIVTTPSNPTVATGAAQGTVIATLAAPLLTNPTYSIVNGTGRYQISGNQLQVGAVEIDIANGTTDTVSIKALGDDGVSSLTATLTLTVGPPGAPITADYNFVTGYYFGGALTDFANAQTSSITETWNDGHSTTFGANTVRRTDLGVKVRGTSLEYIGPHSMDMSVWSKESSADWATVTVTDLGVQSDGFHPIRFSSSNTTSGSIGAGAIPEALNTGDVILIKTRAKRPPAGTEFCGIFWGYRALGAQDLNQLAHVAGGAGIMDGSDFLSGEFISNNGACQIQGYTINDDGTYDLRISYTVEQNWAAGTFEVVFSSVSQNTAEAADVYGVQVTRGATDQAWMATNTTVLTLPADQLTYTDPTGIFANAQGFAVLEVQAIDHQTLGTGGIANSTPGQFLKIGANTLLEPVGPTAFKAKGGAATAVGLGGFRGIVRLAITWDNTANSGTGSWAAYANGGKIASGTGVTGAAGTVAFLNAITGQLRRFTAGKSVLSNVDAQRMSQLWNKSFVNPGKALVPGAATQTFYDDFDVNSLETLPDASGFPYGSFEALAAAYAPTKDAVHLWKPRAHFYTSNQYGNAEQQINHELQEYLDPQFADFKTITFANSCMVGVTALTSTLTAGQQAQVSDNPDTPGTKYKFVSWMMTTYGDNNTGGGFNQKFGIFNFRAKLVAHKGSWPAFWLYNYNDTSELDIEEYYGTDPTGTTTNIHTDNFAHNLSGLEMEMGYDISQDFHDWTGWWVQGTYKKYFDGEEIFSNPTLTDFDNNPKFILMNCAVQPHPTAPFDTGDPAPDATSIATLPWNCQVDRVRVFQFGA